MLSGCVKTPPFLPDSFLFDEPCVLQYQSTTSFGSSLATSADGKLFVGTPDYGSNGGVAIFDALQACNSEPSTFLEGPVDGGNIGFSVTHSKFNDIEWLVTGSPKRSPHGGLYASQKVQGWQPLSELPLLDSTGALPINVSPNRGSVNDFGEVLATIRGTFGSRDELVVGVPAFSNVQGVNAGAVVRLWRTQDNTDWQGSLIAPGASQTGYALSVGQGSIFFSQKGADSGLFQLEASSDALTKVTECHGQSSSNETSTLVLGKLNNNESCLERFDSDGKQTIALDLGSRTIGSAITHIGDSGYFAVTTANGESGEVVIFDSSGEVSQLSSDSATFGLTLSAHQDAADHHLIVGDPAKSRVYVFRLKREAQKSN